MKILFDNCVDRRLKNHLKDYEAKTAYEMGWADYTNGRLLAEAGKDFDVMITTDKNIKHQQNLNTLPIAIIVLNAKSNRLQNLTALIPKAKDILIAFTPRKFYEVKEDEIQ